MTRGYMITWEGTGRKQSKEEEEYDEW